MVEIDPAFTSQICSCCGRRTRPTGEGSATPARRAASRSTPHVNATVNILRRGLTALGLEPRPTGAQEGHQLHERQGNLAPESPG